ncbi:hypothetical protein ACF06P_35630 [Streptomyces sp. NPDC015684]|uniref:hypothetical protein n=1 Tax=Streptomyces sp. NPDC015684 TaxID=3364963 RepID=UPI0036FF5957
MSALLSRRITVAEYLVQRGLPADWRFGSPLGRVAAEIYRDNYRCEPGRAYRWINGRFRRVMAYRPEETHVLTAAWDRYGRTAGQRRAPVAPARRPYANSFVSGDAMRWTPSNAPIRSHP